MLRLIRLSVFCLMISSHVQGQSNINFEAHVNAATLIVEGKIISSKSFYKDGNIFTSYEMEVYNQFKGERLLPIIDFVKVGGVIGNEGLSVYPTQAIHNNEMGMFLLKQTDFYGNKNYRLLTATSSFLPIDYSIQEIYGSMIDGNQCKLIELYARIQRITGRRYTKIKDYVFKPKVVSRDVKITSIDKTSVCAGCNEVITVTGTGFLANRGNFGAVLFTNSNLPIESITIPGIVYNSWSDTQIELVVPYEAGHGSIVIRNNYFEHSVPSVQKLEVLYNIMNTPKGFEIRLIDDESDGDNGYKFAFSDETANNGVDFTAVPNAPELVYDAFSYFNHNIPNFAIYLDASCPTTDLQKPANDNINLISFDNDLWDLDMMVGDNSYGAIYMRWIKCGNSEPEVVDIDMILRRDGDPNLVLGEVKWNFRDTFPKTNEMDFKSVVMHQLGHAMLMGHVQTDSMLMYNYLAPGFSKQKFETNDSLAANWVHEQSKSYNPPLVNCLYQFGQVRPYGDYDSSQTCGLILAIQSIELNLYNENNEFVSLDFEVLGEEDVEVYEIYRKTASTNLKLIASISPKNNNEASNNYYYKDVQLGNGVNTYKVIGINNDGSILSSNLKTVNIEIERNVQLLENPVVNEILRLSIPDKLKGIPIAIFNLNGKQFKVGSMKNSISISGLPIGAYVLSYRDLGVKKAIKFIKLD